MKTFATICTGFDGVGIGAQDAGFQLIWGIEKRPDVAEVANVNLGGHVKVADLLDEDPFDYERPDGLHASLPCPNFSPAKNGASETALDIALAQKTADFIVALQPEVFTLENVWYYRHSKSLRIIEDTLFGAGYWVNIEQVNAANYGVPQTRKRLILRAVRGGFVPYLPPSIGEWESWYGAIADLFSTMPETKLAPWQMALLPNEITSMLIGNQRVSDGGKERAAPGHARRNQPAMTLTTMNTSNLKAYLVDGANSGRDGITVRHANEPSFTLTSGLGVKGSNRILTSSRVLQLTPRAAARLQTFPDWYQLPETKALAGYGIGNAVPPLMMQRIMEGLITA